VKPLFEGTRVLVGLASKHLGERQLPHGSGFSEDKNNHNAINGLFGKHCKMKEYYITIAT
jgi:hypothetical protein